MDHGLSAQYRLTTSAQYQAVFAYGRRICEQYWCVNARFNHKSLPRLGLAISKNLVPRAVDRNLYKRIAREVFRTHKHRLPAFDYVVSARRYTANRRRLRAELIELLLHTANHASSDTGSD